MTKNRDRRRLKIDLINRLVENHSVVLLKMLSYIPPGNRSDLVKSLAWQSSVYVHKAAIEKYERDHNLQECLVASIRGSRAFSERNAIYDDFINKIHKSGCISDNLEKPSDVCEEGCQCFFDMSITFLTYSGSGVRDVSILAEELQDEFGVIHAKLYSNHDLFYLPPPIS